MICLIVIQDELFEKYFQKYAEMANSVGVDTPELFKLALQSPNVILSNNEKSDSKASWEKVREVLLNALEDCDDFRKKEGEVLMRKFRESLNLIGGQPGAYSGPGAQKERTADE